MANQITRDIYVLRKSIIEPIHYVRLTNAVDIVFNMRDYDIPSGAVAAVYAQKPDGTAVYSNATISDNAVTVEMTTQMVAVLGVGHLQVRIQSGSNSADVLCSFVVPLIVEPNFTEGDFPPSQNENGFFGDVKEHLQQVESDMTTMKEEWTEFQDDITQQVQEIQEEQTAQGSEITDLQKKVAKLDEEKSPALVLDASGSWVTVEDSGDSAANGLTIHGKSTQVVTTGAQLWQNPGEGTVNGVTLTQLEDGWINLNGTCTQSNNFIVFSRSLETGEYTLSIEKIGSFPDDYNSLAQVSSYETGKYISIANNSSVLFASSQLTGANDYQYRIRIEEGFSYNNAKVRVMFQKGNEVTSWEPYTGGAPSPSPDYPQEIKSVGDSGSVKVVSTGKNMYSGGDVENITAENNESYVFPSPGGQLRIDCALESVSGTPDAYFNFAYYDGNDIYLGSNGERRSIPENGTNFFYIMTGINAGGTGKNVDMNKVKKIIITFKMYQNAAGEYNAKDIIVQKNEGTISKFTGYQYSTATFSTPNGLPGIPVDSGGNYTDEDGQQWICDEIDTKAGVYRQRVGKITFDGSSDEDWHQQLSTHGIVLTKIPDAMPSQVVICDYFLNYTFNGQYYEDGTSLLSNKNIVFMVADVLGISSIDEWKTWLSTHPVTLIYPLATPVETPLSDAELIGAGNLRTFATVTNATTEDPVEPEITLEYAADLKTYIDKKLAEISAATLENATNASQ